MAAHGRCARVGRAWSRDRSTGVGPSGDLRSSRPPGRARTSRRAGASGACWASRTKGGSRCSRACGDDWRDQNRPRRSRVVATQPPDWHSGDRLCLLPVKRRLAERWSSCCRLRSRSGPRRRAEGLVRVECNDLAGGWHRHRATRRWHHHGRGAVRRLWRDLSTDDDRAEDVTLGRSARIASFCSAWRRRPTPGDRVSLVSDHRGFAGTWPFRPPHGTSWLGALTYYATGRRSSRHPAPARRPPLALTRRPTSPSGNR